VAVAFALGFATAACELIGGIEDLQLTPGLDGGHDARLDARLDVKAPMDVPPRMDVAPLPCTAMPDAGTVCAVVDTDPANPPPGYGALVGGVGTLDISGKGALVIYLFDKDPTGGCDPYVNLSPTTTITVPAAGQGLTVNELPLTAVGRAPPGMYWIFAFFEDNGPHPAAKMMSRGTGVNATLPGDLVTPVDTATTAYPTVVLRANETTSVSLVLEPLRGLQVDFQPSSQLKTAAKADTSIKGDGPGSIIIFDGDGGITDPATTFLDFAAIPCINLKLQTGATDAIPIVGEVSTGKHDVYCNIYDYAPPNVCMNPLPAGTLESSELGVLVTIDATSWTSSVTVPILGLGPNGTGAGTGAPAMCK